ncbi:MAG: single-stranded DNA-binding protein [Limnochordales bacterium]
MNQVQLVGRLVRNPELRYTKNGRALCFITVAVDGYYDKQKKDTVTDFIPVQLWGKTAEQVAKGVKKGTLVSVVGRISSGSYEKNGSKVYTLDIIGEEVKFLARPKGSD